MHRRHPHTQVFWTLLVMGPSIALGCHADVHSDGALAYTTVYEPPPDRRVEEPPETAPDSDMFWAPGYWHWQGQAWAWMEGRWLLRRPGYVYVSPGWVRRGRGWVYEEESWREVGRGRGRARFRELGDQNGRRRWRERDGGADRSGRDRAAGEGWRSRRRNVGIRTASDAGIARP